ncbi:MULTISPECIES: hypothetical protein [unclassified Paenibacillus]|uniref:hypothetical protein n=1 Tax=unclassified Paenibacillus TaxID=185978 RepID=UPI001049A1DE|nr:MULTISPECIES: hypothetical protein [unclassified Paenibacillus]NIK69911.1 hypothetical protein [Paenibacillus sp. BK720]TCM97745.1 hypothetical protein EV294_103173 [Paenibacillus sp. BK033]
MVDEFEFFRNVQTYYQHMRFQVQFTYRILHKTNKSAKAQGSFNCRVNPRTQQVEYQMSLQSETIARPFSEKSSFLFSSQYPEIPPQSVIIENYPILKLKYPVPINYDWYSFIFKGTQEAFTVQSLQQVFDKYRCTGADGEDVDAGLKVAAVSIDWYNGMKRTKV